MVCFAIVCWGSGVTDRDRSKLARLVRRASSVQDCLLESIQEVADGRMVATLISIMNNTSQTLHHIVESLSSSFSSGLLHPQCRKEPHVIPARSHQAGQLHAVKVIFSHTSYRCTKTLISMSIYVYITSFNCKHNVNV